MEDKPKNKSAQELGRLGGLKGGIARWAKISAEERSSIMSKVALAKYRKSNETQNQP